MKKNKKANTQANGESKRSDDSPKQNSQKKEQNDSYSKFFMNKAMEGESIKEDKKETEKVTHRVKRIGGGPSFFSMYFILPCVLLSIVNIGVEYWWHMIYKRKQYEKVQPDVFHVEPSDFRLWLAIMTWTSLLFIAFVLRLARGNMIMGLVFGALLSSILNLNYFPLAFIHIKSWNIFSAQTEFLWQIIKGALLGQIAALLASLCLPPKLYEVETKGDSHEKKE